jgi:hypothetical protein
MTNVSSEERLRQFLDGEAGMPVSAGARMSHVRAALEAGRAFYVDLNSVPEDKRPSVIAEIRELVKRASEQAPAQDMPPSSSAASSSAS